MPDQLKIKLSIANRVYPLTINPKQEEGLRKAAKKIEAMIGQFEQNYSVRDKQDVTCHVCTSVCCPSRAKINR
jgi:cell division protein ZapA (FtsZ GTPase activity inhibitor)